MFKKFFPMFILLVVVGTGVGYFLYFPIKSQPTPNPSQNQKAGNSKDNASTGSKAVPSVKAYAALQFNVSEDKVTVLSSEKKEWPNICLGMDIKDYDCTKKVVTGYEVVVEAGGYTTRYRSSDDGSIIRVVKE